ncbi:MAG: hypothetical protein MHPSP_002778, partial [Paramarteilia canceri]
MKVFGEGSEGFPLSLKVSGAISDLLERVSKHSNSECEDILNSTDDPFLLYEFLNNPPLKQFCQIYIQTTSDHSLPIRVAHCAVESSFHILVRQSSASSLQYSQALKIVKSLLYECLEKLIPGLINCFDLNTACLGFLFGVQVDLKVIYSMIESILEIAMKMKAKSEDGMS